MLSDACSEFLNEFEQAARKLAEAIHQYSAPVFGAAYGEEIDALRRTCAKMESNPLDLDARVDLLRLAASVMRFHNTPPFTAESASHEADMLALLRLLCQRKSADDRDISRPFFVPRGEANEKSPRE